MSGLEGRRVRLERLGRRHIPALHAITTADDVIGGWPLHGRMLDPPQLEGYLWRQSQLQYAVVRRDSDEIIGLVQAVQDDRRSGLADVAITVAPELWRAGWPLEGAVLLADHLFDQLGYRKLYFSMPAGVRARLGGGLDTLLHLECTLSRHLRPGNDDDGDDHGDGDHGDDGGYEDLHIFALHRDQRDNPAWRLLQGGR